MTDEPMYLISESELKKVTHFNWMEVWDRVRARGFERNIHENKD